MSRSLLLAGCLFLGCIAVAAAQQPLTITRQNFAYPAGNDTVYTVTPAADVPVPAEGANQAWDYSSLTLGSFGMVYCDNRTDAAFPGANFYTTNIWDTFAMSRGYYFNEANYVTDEGYYAAGITIDEQPYGLGSLTMNPADSMNFLQSSTVYESPRYVLRFPLTYGSTCNNVFTREAPLELTLNAYGVVKAPGVKRIHFVQTDSIVGWGTLTLPLATGGTVSMRTLLMKRYVTEVDSFFLYNQPAPAALLAAFQISQGMVTKGGRYLFFRENARSAALWFYFSDQDFTIPANVYVDKAIESITTGVDRPAAANIRADVYPNPSHNGVFTINTNRRATGITVRNILGMEIMNRQVSDGPLTVTLPKSSIPGMYFYELRDAGGAVMQTGKMLLAK
jgi:hypothetical protein